MISEHEKRFLDQVKVFKLIGYGRMMQIISNAWYSEVGGGAHVANTCVDLLSEKEKKAFLQVLETEKAQGMKYIGW